jgi:hypothetical protein
MVVNLDDNLQYFMGIPDSTNGKVPKVFDQVLLVIENLFTKMLTNEKF